MRTSKKKALGVAAIAGAVLFASGCGTPRTRVDRDASLDEAIVRYARGDLDGAEAVLSRILAERSQVAPDPTVFFYLGRIYLARGDYEKAADAFSTGRALGGDFRFSEYFEEAQRHLTASPERIAQLSCVTRGQIAALLEAMFGSSLRRHLLAGGSLSSDVAGPERALVRDGETPRERPNDDPVTLVSRAGVMGVLPDGDFHAEAAVTLPAFYGIVRRLAAILGVPGEVSTSFFPAGLRSTIPRVGEQPGGEPEGVPFVSGREVLRIFGALSEAARATDE